jgi:hypothetical protein
VKVSIGPRHFHGAVTPRHFDVAVASGRSGSTGRDLSLTLGAWLKRDSLARYAAELARLGGKARAKKLTTERRREIARKAARARWEGEEGRVTTVADVERLLARARRLRDGIREMKGTGASWEVTFPDGITERYTIKGIKPVEHIEDDVAALFVWLWSAKDYLKSLASARGRNPQVIENLVNRTPALCLLADVANRLKHASLERRSRSGCSPRLGRPEFKGHQSGVRSIEVSAAGVTIEPTSPDAVELRYPVVDASGSLVADATVLLTSAIAYWEKALAEL